MSCYLSSGKPSGKKRKEAIKTISVASLVLDLTPPHSFIQKMAKTSFCFLSDGFSYYSLLPTTLAEYFMTFHG